ncbi:MAG: M18 family aminopeptidase, partial [Pseudomonadota bacterium]|nr:M18 family aminopeptidase [Pseudomonadota bacterium]
RISYRSQDGELRNRLINTERAIGCIPSLAIHLDREANSNRSINAQTDLPVLISQPEKAPDFNALLKQLLIEQGGSDVDTVLDYELSFYDVQGAALVGLEQEFIASARLDNLLSCFIGLQALLSAPSDQHSVLVSNDHEEVGSMSSSGAQGPMLESVLRRIAGDESRWQRAIAHSLMISADNAHGVHPNFSDRHDANHGPLLNRGAVIKINVNQRYATNSETSAAFRHLCQQCQQPVQSFVVRSDMACGSTIGPITSSALGVATLDIGVPTFAMHSIRELAGADDAVGLSQVLAAFYARQ